MKKLFQLCLFSFFLIGLSSNVSFAQSNCCGQPLAPVFEPTGDCGEFTICLPNYVNCNVTNIWTIGLPNLNWPLNGNCITLSGFQPGQQLNFFLQVGVQGCSNYFEQASYLVTDDGCGVDPCCDAVVEAIAKPNGDCGSFDVCLEGLDNCDVTAIIPSYLSSSSVTSSVNGNCVTFSGLNVGDVFNYDITVQIDGCDDIVLNETYVVTEDGCDPCCLAPDINEVDFYQIPGYNVLRICMPVSPCPDQPNLLYGLSFLEKCGEDPGIWSITASPNNCLYLRFKPCCEYRFRVGYRSNDCSDVQWSALHVWESPCDGGIINTNPDVALFREEALPPEVLESLKTEAVVSPNPFNEEFQIQFSAQREEPYQLVIYDLQGKVVTQMKGQLNKGQNSIRVTALQNMPSGSYIYQLNSENHRISDKLVKF